MDRIRRQLKAVIDGPNSDIDRIIGSIRENSGQISNKLREEFAVLEDEAVAARVVAAVVS